MQQQLSVENKFSQFTSKELHSIGQLVSSIAPVSFSTLDTYYHHVINQFTFPQFNSVSLQRSWISSHQQLTPNSSNCCGYKNCGCNSYHFSSSHDPYKVYYGKEDHHLYSMAKTTEIIHENGLYGDTLNGLVKEKTSQTGESDQILSSLHDLDPSVITSPCLSSSSSLIEEKSNTEHIQEICKSGKRPRYTKAQLGHMHSVLQRTTKPNAVDIMELKKLTGLNDLQIRGWFSYTKRKLKRMKANPPKEASRIIGYVSTAPSSHVPQAVDAANSEKIGASFPQPFTIASTSTGSQLPMSSQNVHMIPLSTNVDINKRRERMDFIRIIPLDALMKCIGDCEVRLSCLIMLYMKKSLDMWRTLLTETARLQEMAVGCNPFTVHQINLMKAWRNSFIGETSESLSEEKQGRLVFLREEIIDIWLMVITYGKLTGIDLESAIDEFCYKDEIERVPAANSFLVPAILRYMETHFQ